jgi:hypothetical protein
MVNIYTFCRSTIRKYFRIKQFIKFDTTTILLKKLFLMALLIMTLLMMTKLLMALLIITLLL